MLIGRQHAQELEACLQTAPSMQKHLCDDALDFMQHVDSTHELCLLRIIGSQVEVVHSPAMTMRSEELLTWSSMQQAARAVQPH